METAPSEAFQGAAEEIVEVNNDEKEIVVGNLDAPNKETNTCIGIFIRSIKITNYFLFIIIHFHDLSSCSLRGLGRGRLHYLLAGEEGLVLSARDALDDDGEGDSRRQEGLLPIVSAKSRHSAQKLQHQRDCPAIKYGG